MVIADTSVWIDYFNGTLSVETNALDAALEQGEVAIGDIIFLEILQGFRSDRDYKMARSKLSVLEQYEMLGRDIVIKCADNYRLLKKKGITIRKTNDIIIATFCIENKVPLLFSDRDFLPFVKHLKLKSALIKT
ncbi:twitching motility protein PilT [Candidatus Tenderia electrophaga]|uniref:Twitching motility protein PilT n=1 Tax=Candidatus Tenderia electrophaga TaxID=1748243 RepID=A0A0S2TG62_9GAMM|nr:twitching motility protein PilT [Candidatus Tenderia electrophaga]